MLDQTVREDWWRTHSLSLTPTHKTIYSCCEIKRHIYIYDFNRFWQIMASSINMYADSLKKYIYKKCLVAKPLSMDSNSTSPKKQCNFSLLWAHHLQGPYISAVHCKCWQLSALGVANWPLAAHSGFCKLLAKAQNIHNNTSHKHT